MPDLPTGPFDLRGLRLDLDRDTERTLRATARLEALRKKREALWSLHPWPFLRDAVWTMDQVKGGTGGAKRKFPGEPTEPAPDCPCADGGCGSYYEHLANLWLATSRLVIPKSRRMLASWELIACHYWLARYRPGSAIAFAARKQGQNDSEGSAELVKRAWQIHQNLPEDAQKRPATYSWCRLRFDDTGSEILGIAEGANQARQYTFTAYLADEFAFWEKAAETYHALLPTLEGGGRLTIISSANPGFMEQLVKDQFQPTGAA